jgi:hypothetical protein
MINYYIKRINLPGKQYSLSLSVFNPHYKNFPNDSIKETTIDYREELIIHVGPISLNLPAHQRKYTKYFDFWTKDLMIGGNSRFTLRLDKEEFNGPYVHIPFVLPKKRLNLLSLFSILTLGLFILGSSNAISSIAANYGLTFISEWFVGIVGTVLTAIPIAWLELKEFK